RASRLLTETSLDALADPTTTYVYDLLGRVTSSTDTSGTITLTTYDRLGRTATTNVDGGLSSNAYDRAGNLLSTKNPTGDVTATVVDGLDRTVQSITNCTNTGTSPPVAFVVCTGAGTHDASTNLTTTTYYDAVGNTLAMKDPAGIAT